MNKKNIVGVDMNDVIPYFKIGDIVKYTNAENTENNDKYKVKKVTTNCLQIIKISDGNQQNNDGRQQNNNTTTDIYIKIEKSFEKKEINYKDKDQSVKIEIIYDKDSLGKFKQFIALMGKTYSDISKFTKPLRKYLKDEGGEILDETAADIYDGMGSKKGNKCLKSNKDYVGLFDIDLPIPYSIKPGFLMKGLTVAQKKKLYRKFKKNYVKNKDTLKDEIAPSLTPFSKKYWYMYEKNPKNNSKNKETKPKKPTLRQMNEVHNELIRLKKCGCLSENAPMEKCKFLNKTLKYFQLKKKELTKQNGESQDSVQTGGDSSKGEYENTLQGNNAAVMNKILEVKKKYKKKNKKEGDNNSSSKYGLVNNESDVKKKDELIEASIPINGIDETKFKKKFVEKLYDRLDEKKDKLYDERVMLMKGIKPDLKDKFYIRWWKYIKTIPFRLKIFWSLRWGQIITILLLYISFKIYKKNKNLTFFVMLLLGVNMFYEMYTGTSNTIFKFLIFSFLSIFILIILQGVLHIFDTGCSNISLSDKDNITTYRNDLYLFSFIGILLLLISLRGLCNFVPWLNFDWVLYKIAFLLYIIQFTVTYHGHDLSSPIGNVADTFFVLCSFNALYQYLYFPDTIGDDFKLKNLSKFGDVLNTEYYMNKIFDVNNS